MYWFKQFINNRTNPKLITNPKISSDRRRLSFNNYARISWLKVSYRQKKTERSEVTCGKSSMASQCEPTPYRLSDFYSVDHTRRESAKQYWQILNEANYLWIIWVLNSKCVEMEEMSGELKYFLTLNDVDVVLHPWLESRVATLWLC